MGQGDGCLTGKALGGLTTQEIDMKRICIDVGGTFTDCLVLDERGELQQFKSPTTPQDPSVGFLACLEKAAGEYHQSLGGFLADMDLLIHGTTLATNTPIKRDAAKIQT